MEHRKKPIPSAFLKTLPSHRRKQKQQQLLLKRHPPQRSHHQTLGSPLHDSDSSRVSFANRNADMDVNKDEAPAKKDCYEEPEPLPIKGEPQMDENAEVRFSTTMTPTINTERTTAVFTMDEFWKHQKEMIQIMISHEISRVTQKLEQQIQCLNEENQRLRQQHQSIHQDYDTQMSMLQSQVSKLGAMYQETRLKYEQKKREMANYKKEQEAYLNTLPFQIDEQGQVILKTKVHLANPVLNTKINLDESQYPEVEVMNLLNPNVRNGICSKEKDGNYDTVTEKINETRKFEYYEQKDSSTFNPRRVTMDIESSLKERKDSHSSTETDGTHLDDDKDKKNNNGFHTLQKEPSHSSNILKSLEKEQMPLPEKVKEVPIHSEEASFLESASAFNPNFDLNIEDDSEESDREEKEEGDRTMTFDKDQPRPPSPILSSLRSVTPMTHRKKDVNDDVVSNNRKRQYETSTEISDVQATKRIVRGGSSSIATSASDHLKDTNPSFKYKEVVRGKNARTALNGYDCEQCAGFIHAMLEGKGSNFYNHKNLVCTCSRHRSKWSPDKTPEGFWEMSFADSIAERKKQSQEKKDMENSSQDTSGSGINEVHSMAY